MLNNRFVLFSVAVLVELDGAAYAVFINHVRKCRQNVCRICRACCLDRFQRYEVRVITHRGYRRDLVVAVVVRLRGGIRVNPFLDAVIEFRVSAFLIEGRYVQFDIFTLCRFQNNVGVPSVACQNRHIQFLCFCLVDDQRSCFDGYRGVEYVAIFRFCVRNIGCEVRISFWELLFHNFAAELFKRFYKVFYQTYGVVVAELG